MRLASVRLTKPASRSPRSRFIRPKKVKSASIRRYPPIHSGTAPPGQSGPAPYSSEIGSPNDFYMRFPPVFDTTSPGGRAAADGPRWHASRESHPSEDRSELPPLPAPDVIRGCGWTGVSLSLAGVGPEAPFRASGRNAKQPATGCFVDGWVPLCTLLAALIGASAEMSFPLCPYRWSSRILQRRFSSPPGAARQLSYPAAGYSLVKLHEGVKCPLTV